MKTSSKIMTVLSGMFLIALGVICMCSPVETLLSLSWLLGIMLIGAGLSTVGFWIKAHRFLPSAGTVLMSGMLEILLGCLVAVNIFETANSLTFLFAFFALMGGINIAVHSFDFKKFGFGGWWCIFAIGILAAVLGVLCFVKPIAAARAISIILGVSVILDGVAQITVVFGISRFERKVTNAINDVKDAITGKLSGK